MRQHTNSGHTRAWSYSPPCHLYLYFTFHVLAGPATSSVRVHMPTAARVTSASRRALAMSYTSAAADKRLCSAEHTLPRTPTNAGTAAFRHALLVPLLALSDEDTGIPPVLDVCDRTVGRSWEGIDGSDFLGVFVPHKQSARR